MKKNTKNVIFSVAMASLLTITFIPPVPTASATQPKKSTIQYNNEVFTKKLYKNTTKIKFCYTITKDKKIIKKVYALLAKMKLKQKELNPSEPKKAGFVSIFIYTKNNKIKGYSFQADQVSTDSKKYTITENDPLDKIREIYNSIKKAK